MIENIKKIFRTYHHKEIMLVGLLLSSIIIYSGLTIAAFIVGYDDVFWVKLSVTIIMVLLLLSYIKWHHVALTAILLFIVLEIDTSLALLSRHLFDFISVFPFFIILGFFFFFSLRTALWMTLAHFLYWAVLTYLRQHLVVNHPMFQSVVSEINMFTSSVLVVLIGIFYHLSTELSYQHLENKNIKNETTLKEIHHRIKNNLNIIASIIGLQINNLDTENAKTPGEVLQNSKLRIEAIAMIHQSLYQNHHLESVKFSSYIRDLTNLINKAYNRNISVKIDADQITLPLETMIHLGIIINELFTNSIKYAFTRDQIDDQIAIQLTQNENRYILKYHENRNDHIDMEKILTSKSLGMRLIQLTVKQLKGTLEVTHNKGLIITIEFSIKN